MDGGERVVRGKMEYLLFLRRLTPKRGFCSMVRDIMIQEQAFGNLLILL